MWTFIETDKININDIKFADIAVISQFNIPIKPSIKNNEYNDGAKDIITHLNSL